MSVIFNEPGGGQTLSNPSQQNNVFQFVQTTKPTERSAGVALVAGDRWYKPTDNELLGSSGYWYWNGTYWLSAAAITCGGFAQNSFFAVISGANTSEGYLLPSFNLFISSCYYTLTNVGGTGTIQLNVFYTRPGNNNYTVNVVDTSTSLPATFVNFNQVLINDTSTPINIVTMSVTKTGTPTYTVACLLFNLHRIHP